MEGTESADTRLLREQAFFDAAVDGAGLDPPPEGWEPNKTEFELAILDGAGDINGARVLDLGCGAGDLTFRLLDAGAEVTGIDVSPGSVDVARRRIEEHRPGAPVEFAVGPAEKTGLRAGGFDLVVGKWVLHHLDIPRAAAEIHRLLKPGGRGVFVETSGLNPLLRFAREYLPDRVGARYGTDDERPISAGDVAVLDSQFDTCTVDYPNFVFFYLLSRNLFDHRWPRLNSGLRRADSIVGERMHWAGRLSYYARITLAR